jgi:hypothetical protein
MSGIKYYMIIVEQRPRKLLVLINPVSGRSKGRSTYEQKVAPFFKEAGIETDVIGNVGWY